MVNDDLINTMLKKYVDKHYRITDITPLYPISIKHPVAFTLWDIEKNEACDWHIIINELEKIFSVTTSQINKAILELVKEERLRQQRILEAKRASNKNERHSF